MARQRGISLDESGAVQIAAKGLLHGPDLSSLDRSVKDMMIVDPAMSDGWALIAAELEQGLNRRPSGQKKSDRIKQISISPKQSGS